MKNRALALPTSGTLPLLRPRLGPATVLVCGALLAGCGASQAQKSTPAPARDPLAQLAALVGDAACDRDDQCRTAPIGNRACGGPEAFLAWSTKRTDFKALDAALANLATERARNSGPGGQVSICAVVSDPGASCVASSGTSRMCKLRSGSDAAMK